VILVVDASVAVKWTLPEASTEAHTQEALAVLATIRTGRASFVQPPHWLLEIAAVVVRLRPEFVDEILAFLDVLRVSIADEIHVLRRAARLARELDHHLFDTLYHAVALEHDGLLVTADHVYARKAAHLGNMIELQHWSGLSAKPS
jgi:predicted nucleic acid-binding protein